MRSCKMPCIPRSALLDVVSSLLRAGASADYDRAGTSAWLDVDWSAARHRVDVDGVGVEYVDLAPGDGAASTVLLVHGLGASWPVWLEQLPAFADAGHRVLALDLPGFGGSDLPAEPISVAGYARTAAGLLDALGVARAHVVGHSLGGFVAAELALRRPDLVDHVVLAAPALLWQEYRRSGPLVALASTADAVTRAAVRASRRRPDRRHRREREQAAPRRERGGIAGAAAVPVPRRPRLRAAVLGASGVHVPQRVPPELQVELLRIAQRTPGYLGALRALRGLDLSPELGRVRAPALVVWGDRDTLVGVEQLNRLHALLPAARTLVLERTGHRLMIERPAAFNAAVLDFLSG